MQLSIFDIETLPGMACRKPTKKYPNGRTGTHAGYDAHRKEAREEPCRECHEANKEYKKAHYRANKDRHLEACRKWYWDNLEQARATRAEYREANIEQAREYNRQYVRGNKEMISQKQREYYLKNKDSIKEYQARWHQENKENSRSSRRKRRALLRKLPSSPYTVQDIANEYGRICYLCETEVDPAGENFTPASLHVDHVHPISREGCPGDILENCRIVHAKCNLVKGTRLVSELTLPFPPPHATATDLPGTPVQAQ